MDDLISRQAAIDAINGLHDKPNAWLDCAVDTIKTLPSADNDSLYERLNEAHNEGYDIGYWAGRRDYEKKWIPCSDRLPNEGVEVLVSAWTDSIMIAWLEDGEWTTDEFSFEENCDVIAWCPLPKPYKAEVENDE